MSFSITGGAAAPAEASGRTGAGAEDPEGGRRREEGVSEQS